MVATYDSKPASLFDERELIRTALRGLQEWWAETRGTQPAPVDELVSRVHSLRTTLANHFRHEQQAEPRPTSVERSGVSSIQWDQETRAQAMFLADLDQLIERMRICRPGMDCWQDVSRMFERFLDRLMTHEDARLQRFASPTDRVVQTPTLKGYVLPT